MCDNAFIELTKAQIAWVDDKSDATTRALWARGARPQGGQPIDLDTWMIERRMGNRGEAAWHLWTDRKFRWTLNEPHIPGQRLPDFGDFMDIKTVHYNRAQLWLTPDCPPHWTYLLVSCSMHPLYRLVGWCWGEEAKRDEYWRTDVPRDPAFVVEQSDPLLRGPEMLRQMALATSGKHPCREQFPV